MSSIEYIVRHVRSGISMDFLIYRVYIYIYVYVNTQVADIIDFCERYPEPLYFVFYVIH